MTRKSSNLPNMFDIFSNAWERLLSGRSKNLRAFVPPCEISPKFRSTKNSACRPIPMKHKPLRIESLENRELLSVSGWFERLTDVPTYSPLAEVREGETVFIPNQWIVQLNQSTLKNVDSVNAAANYLLPYGITVYGGLGAKGLLLVSTATVSYAPEMTSWSIFASMDCLDYWEQDSYFCTSGISSSVNDPYVKNQWGLDSIDLGN